MKYYKSFPVSESNCQTTLSFSRHAILILWGSYFQKTVNTFFTVHIIPYWHSSKKKKIHQTLENVQNLKKTHFESNETKLNNFFLSYLFQLRFLFHLNVTALHFYFGKHNLVNIIIPNSALKNCVISGYSTSSRHHFQILCYSSFSRSSDSSGNSKICFFRFFIKIINITYSRPHEVLKARNGDDGICNYKWPNRLYCSKAIYLHRIP